MARARLVPVLVTALLALAALVGLGVGTRHHHGSDLGAYRGGGPVGISGTSLTLDGHPHFFVGLDVYSAATDYGVDPGCGPEFAPGQLDALLAELPSGSLLRVWAFQGDFATSAATHRVDWGPLDGVMSDAAAHHDLVILVLGDQGGTCDGDVWQDPAWYDGGYRRVQDPTGLTPLSYWDYVHLAVEHFRRAPALAMWEPINEAEASTCPGGDLEGTCVGGHTCPSEAVAAAALRSFYDNVGTAIEHLDPRHPVESGLLGGNQCGIVGRDFLRLAASPGIDVLSFHDYYPARTLLGGPLGSSVGARLRQARLVGKPILAGEVGIPAASYSVACPDLAARAVDFARKIVAQRALGLAGALLWDLVPQPDPAGDCSLDIAPGDPAFATLAALAGASDLSR